MSRISKAIDGLILVLAIAAVSIAALSYYGQRNTSPPAGEEASDGSELIGSVLPALEVLGGPGEPTKTFWFDDTDATLALVFTSTCSYCEANAERWRNLLDEIPERVQVVGVNMESEEVARRWLGRHGLEPDRLIVPASVEDMNDLWKIRWVPATLVVAPDGTVQFGRYGVLAAGDFREAVQQAESHTLTGL